jgi:ABC-type microcin C transport system permease subunit YejB
MREMLRLLVTRVASAIPSLVGVVLIVFVLTRALPGDPAAFFAGPAATPEAVEEVRQRLGLDRGAPGQLVSYLRSLAAGDLGKSLTTGQPVVDELRTRLPASLELTLMGLLLAAAVGIPLGCWRRPGRDLRSTTCAGCWGRSGCRCRPSSPGSSWSTSSTSCSAGRPPRSGASTPSRRHRRR